VGRDVLTDGALPLSYCVYIYIYIYIVLHHMIAPDLLLEIDRTCSSSSIWRELFQFSDVRVTVLH
jgi:hypothetical protein